MAGTLHSQKPPRGQPDAIALLTASPSAPRLPGRQSDYRKGYLGDLDHYATPLGFAVLKGADFLISDIRDLISGCAQKSPSDWRLNLDYHFGGFAKLTTELEEFMQDFKRRHEIDLDHVYTGKMMYGIFELVRTGYFTEGQTIVAVHTGGVKAWRAPLGREGIEHPSSG